MRARRLWMIFGPACLAAAGVACADDGTEPTSATPPTSDADAAVSLPPATTGDGGDASDANTPDVQAPSVPACSDAGWCTTNVPDPSIRFYALVPFETKAFALGWLEGRTSPLEFDGTKWSALAGDAWNTAPKNAQKLYAIAAPNEHELWLGGADGFLARGVDTSGSWVWTTVDIDTTETIRSIYRLSSDDIYVAAGQRILRRGGDGTWTLEHESLAGPLSEWADSTPAVFTAVIGTGPNDVWAIGSRLTCTYAAHRTSEGWTTVIDSIAEWYPDEPQYSYCYGAEEIPSIPIPLALPYTRTPGHVFAALEDGNGTNTFVHLSAEAGGETNLGWGTAPLGTKALWQPPGSSKAYAVGFGTVMFTNDVADAGDWHVSTVSFDGKTPTMKWFETVGGTSEKNMWVAGDSYALHRTMP